MREELGAYVLGVLDQDGRRAVEAHLGGCSECRDEVASLAAVRPLLDRLTPDEVGGDLFVPAPRLARPDLDVAVASTGRLRRRLRTWRVVALASAVALVVVLAPDVDRTVELPAPVVTSVDPVAADAADVAGTVAAHAWEWGTTLELDLRALPVRETYELWAIGEDGRRQRAGTWGPTQDGGARVRGATAILRDDLAGVEITDVSGAVLFGAVFAAPPTS